MNDDPNDAELDARMAAAMAKRKKEMEQAKPAASEPAGVLNGPKTAKQLEVMKAEYKSEEEREREEEESSEKGTNP